tara:strand:+ start:109 stop:276 length:168 start_codon:yes stop_codon:yes gene_type:complete
MNYFKITCDDENWWITGFNGSYLSARSYFMGLRNVIESDQTGRETFSTVVKVEVA